MPCMSASSALSLSRHDSSPAADRPSRLPHTGHDGAGKIQLAREQAAAPAEETLPFLQTDPATEQDLPSPR